MYDYGHTPVLLEEVLDGLRLRPDGCYVDCTFGHGGHSRAILERLDGEGRLYAFDRDPAVIEYARQIVSEDARLLFINENFSSLCRELSQQQVCGRVDGVLFDLGVSSPQLDDRQRGFSFQHEGELDMRMTPGTGISATEWINQASEQEIARVLYEFGEERYSRRIARAIVATRKKSPVRLTTQLADIIASASPSREKHKHPATRSFQAIRIYINNELEELHQGLAGAFECLRTGGRFLVISFHSLEDRIVKRFMRDLAKGDPYPRHLPVKAEALRPKLKIIGKMITPGKEEIRNNPRARSARLRIGEKLAA